MIFFFHTKSKVIDFGFFILIFLTCTMILPTAIAFQNNSSEVRSSITLNTTQLTDNTFAFQAGTFSTLTKQPNWSGSLKKVRVVQSTEGNITFAEQAEWDVATLLTIASNKRSISTYNSMRKQTVAFEFNQLPDDIQTLFNQSPNTRIKDDLGVQRVNYLSGDRSMENKNVKPPFRVRNNLLGDIVHSSPVYMSTPTLNITESNYASFYERYKTRPDTLFIGANDGMLHAFSADSGAELFAYIPSPLLRKLPQLTDPNGQFEFTMDGNIRVAEARVANEWKTVLAAGMGKGAQGIFALDVTSPQSFMDGKRALFEFTEHDDSDIGYVTTTPLITKINNKYFVIVTSGYNPTHQQAGQFLFLLSLDKDATTPWSLNHNYYKLNANAPSSTTISKTIDKTADKKTNEIFEATTKLLSQPGLVVNAQGSATFAYAGDLQGNLWRFDLSNLTSATPKIIFTARDENHHFQSISTQPIVVFAPNKGYLILFGTGTDEGSIESLPHARQQNSFYAIRDTPPTDVPISDRSHLAKRIVIKKNMNDQNAYQVTGSDFTYGTAILDKRGWYIDYLNGDVTGERSVSEAAIAHNMLFFNTIVPQTNTSHSYRVNVLSGKSIDTNITGIASHIGMLGSPIILNTELTVDNTNSVGQRNSTQHFAVVNFAKGGSNTAAALIKQDKLKLITGRLSWREIANWQEIRER